MEGRGALLSGGDGRAIVVMQPGISLLQLRESCDGFVAHGCDMAKTRKRTKHGFLRRHSLSIVAILLLILWLVGYRYLDPGSHLGAFCGNAIADWSGSLVLILGTKFLYESGSAESRPYKAARERWAWLDFLHRHSLLLFLLVTGIGWTVLFIRMNTESKWEQVVGNLVSEWVQMAGLVFLTKRLVEIGSKESR